MPTPIELVTRYAPRHRRRRKMRPPRFPLNVERKFVSDQRALVRSLYGLFDELLIPRLPELARAAGVREDAARLDQSYWRTLLTQIFGDIRARWEGAAELARQNARVAAEGVSLHNREQIARQMRSAVGFDLFYDDPDLVDLMEGFEAANVSHIKTIEATAFPQIERIVSDGFRRGQRANTVADQLVNALGVTQSKAEFWARDQIGSLNGQLTRSRQKSLGVNSYVWRTSRDERVRESHRQLEGTVQSWDDPPTVGKRQVHPGEDYLCRCDAEVLIPGDEDEIEKTGPADVPRNPELVKRKRAADRRRRERNRKRQLAQPTEVQL